MTKLNIELILFILVLIPRALSSLFFSTLLAFIFPILFNLWRSLIFSILLILSLSLLYSVDVISLFNCISLMFS